MKVLVAHNRYQSRAPSGENNVVDAEIALLESRGIEVVPLLEDSDRIHGLTRFVAALGPVYSPTGVSQFRRILHAERPDVVHLHNVFPLISPAVVHTARQHDVPVVQTIHNYRHSCAKGVHYRDGHNCLDCLGKRLAYPAVLHGCYRGSRTQSAPMALSQALHHITWNRVSRYLALTPFMADILVRQGVDPAKITIRPSWVPDPGVAGGVGRAVLFVGRLDEGKGVQLLLDAWQMSGANSGRTLHIVGDGPMANVVAEQAAAEPSITFSGRLGPSDVAAAMADAAFVVVPSIWYDGYPLVIAEALGRGRPVLVVEGGSAASAIDESVGWTTPPDAHSLGSALASISDREVAVKSAPARRRYESTNSPEVAAESLLRVYRDVRKST